QDPTNEQLPTTSSYLQDQQPAATHKDQQPAATHKDQQPAATHKDQQPAATTHRTNNSSYLQDQQPAATHRTNMSRTNMGNHPPSRSTVMSDHRPERLP